jgi:hypothetical protein
MAHNPVQFLKGMSEADLDRLYGTEDLCRESLASWRWPKGFSCPMCGETTHCIVGNRRLYQCAQCHTQTSLTAGTMSDNIGLHLKNIFTESELFETSTAENFSVVQLEGNRTVERVVKSVSTTRKPPRTDQRSLRALRVYLSDASFWSDYTSMAFTKNMGQLFDTSSDNNCNY